MKKLDIIKKLIEQQYNNIKLIKKRIEIQNKKGYSSAKIGGANGIKFQYFERQYYNSDILEAKEKIKKAILYIFNNEYNCVSTDSGVLVMTHKIDFLWFKNDLKQRFNINIQEVDTTEINTVNKQPFKIIYNEQ